MPNKEIDIQGIASQPEEIQDIIGNPPGWMLRSGIGVVFFVVITGLFLTGWISYPDTIQANIELTSETPPIDVLAVANGQIDSIFVIDGQAIKSSQPLIYIKNGANPNDIATVEDFIKSFSEKEGDYSTLSFPEGLETGKLNGVIGRFALKFKQLQDLSQDPSPLRKIASLKKEMAKIKALNQVLHQENAIFYQEVQLQEKNYQRNITLHKAGVISDADKEKMEATLLQYRRQYESRKSNIIQNKIKAEQLAAQVIEQKMQRDLQLQNYLTELRELQTDVVNAIHDWRLSYYVIAPLDGTVSLPGNMTQNDFIKSGQLVAGIIPIGGNKHILARGYVPVSGMGKIDTKSRAIIRLAAYPYKEFGTMETHIEHIALLPIDDKQKGGFYEFELSLPDTLVTNFGKTITYQPKMTGTAILITKDRSLAERIFEQFLNLTKNL